MEKAIALPDWLKLNKRVCYCAGGTTHIIKIWTLWYSIYWVTGTIKAIDISLLKEAQEALRSSEARYRAILEEQTDLMARYLPDGTVTFGNC